jgi:uncharacterized OB-fold protein
MSAGSPVLWEAAPDGSSTRLLASRCPSCDRVEFPALADCPTCNLPAVPTTLGPTARLHGCTEVLHAPPDALVDVPYTIAVAAFDEADIAVMGLLEDHLPVEELALGAALEVCTKTHDGGTTYAFRLR